MEKSYKALEEIDIVLKQITDQTEVEVAQTIVEFFKTLPNQKEQEIDTTAVRLAKIRTVYILERLLDLEKDSKNRLRVLSFIDNAIIGLARIIAGNRDGTILDESLVDEAEVDASLAVQQKQLGIILETHVQVPMDKIPQNHPKYEQIKKQAVDRSDGSSIIIVPKSRD